MRRFWLLDDARVFGGGQFNILRLARFIEESLPDRSACVVCPRASELAVRCGTHGIAVAHATFPDLELFSVVQIAVAAGALRRVLARAARDDLIVGASLRTQVYAHAATVGRRRSPRIVHFMVEQDSARRRVTRFLLNRYGAVVVVSEAGARAYRQCLPGVRLHTVNNFLLPEEFEVAVRTTAPTACGAPVIGVLARLIPEKGILELIDELAEIPDAWSRVLVGGERQDKQYARAVEERIVARGLEHRIRLIGHSVEPAPFLATVDALVVPSVGNEGQPTVIIEALAHGRPCIVREPLWSHAFDGLPVVPYRDAHDLKAALARGASADVPPSVLADRFDPMKVISAFEEAGVSARGA